MLGLYSDTWWPKDVSGMEASPRLARKIAISNGYKTFATREYSKSLHRAQKHNNKDFDVTVTILAQESKTSTRKTLEAFWINAQNPEMNRKDECVTITRDLAPFLRLIF
ncbi:hypothetical protein KIN20_029573 [Parelaphostrongylus tenuis]|uniref:Uncharacterized protein n=1 Tax=Parelaphostrongylus tenuis TaxID=148309 RepID=A0AAD5R3F7_PARTN|nr:hypothetical protein KIN20_029573 [Parelaphostrongylus tenuis]